ncbi:GntG family PLP-dependent aldolase [Novipirellula artificiosorum]|uniref:L-allo-threonine aldolase n=1 Tax=Novipirellula artificiosorum TaxID=2528016 RepID=A0A5C6E465_9BACT|nr:GntG family PLP-dependent aldolase [Novipirellula artificiosorum]TWU42226.1 L-allo-threonine aldolase [Novipirellula artificiosorum]
MPEEIDLRSDTVTQPTPAMRKAIAEAVLGDAVIDVDPTVQRLEERTAELLGKQAAVYMPSGSMTNQIALRVHCDRGSEFICEQDCHLYFYEQGAFAALSGLVAKTIQGQDGLLKREHLCGRVNAENDHCVRTRLLCLENTHNRLGGRILPQAGIVDSCHWAKQSGLATHLDGARLWNASVATGISEAELAEPFDSVSVCFSKGLGAPVGSVLAGSNDFVREARRARKLYGGAMRQAGIIAAGAVYALEHHRERLVEDHKHAKQLGDAFTSLPGFSIRGGHIDTNIVAIEIAPERGTAEQVVGKLAERGIRCFAIGPQAIRLVTHLDVGAEKIDRACQVIATLA